MLSELDFRNMFADISTQTSESKVSVKISTEASSRMIGDFTAQFLKAANLPDNTPIGTLSKKATMAYAVGLTLFVKERGYANQICEQVLRMCVKMPKGKFTSIMAKAKTLYTLRKCREYEVRIDRMSKRQSGAIKALKEGKHTTVYKRGGTAHWPTIVDIDGCGAATALIANVKEMHGNPVYNEAGKIANWPPGMDEKVGAAIVTRRNAEATWIAVGKQVVADLASVFGERGSRTDWSLELDPLLCVASTYQHIDVEDDEDEDDEEIEMI